LQAVILIVKEQVLPLISGFIVKPFFEKLPDAEIIFVRAETLQVYLINGVIPAASSASKTPVATEYTIKQF
jgi:hypothetical protein